MKGRGLRKEEIRPVQRQIAVNLIGGYLMVTLDAIGLAGVQKGGGAHNVGTHELLRMLHGPVHMGLRCEVDDHIRLLLLKELEDEGPVGDIALYELVVGLILHGLQVLQIAGIGQLIQVQDHILRIGIYKILYHHAADKAGAACYDDFHSQKILSSYGRPKSAIINSYLEIIITQVRTDFHLYGLEKFL